MALNYNLGVVSDWIDQICNKKQSSYFTPEEKMSALDKAQMWHFNEWKQVYSINQEAQDALLPFKTEYQFTAGNSANGIIILPSNCLHFISLHIQYTEGSNVRYKQVKEILEPELGYVLDSQVRKVQATDARMRLAGSPGIIQLYPKTTNAGFIYYLRRPAVPVYGYTQVGRVITYDPSTSTQLEWTDSYITKLMVKTMQYLGISVDDDFLTQILEVKNQQNT